MNSSKQRRHFEGPEKVAILKRHLINKVPISNLAETGAFFQIQLWQNGTRGFGVVAEVHGQQNRYLK